MHVRTEVLKPQSMATRRHRPFSRRARERLRAWLISPGIKKHLAIRATPLTPEEECGFLAEAKEELEKHVTSAQLIEEFMLDLAAGVALHRIVDTDSVVGSDTLRASYKQTGNSLQRCSRPVTDRPAATVFARSTPEISVSSGNTTGTSEVGTITGRSVGDDAKTAKAREVARLALQRIRSGSSQRKSDDSAP